MDAVDKGTPGVTCTTMEVDCRVVGLDFDGEIGSYQNRARQYNPIQKRGLRAQRAWNLYNYLENSPIDVTDAIGLYPQTRGISGLFKGIFSITSFIARLVLQANNLIDKITQIPGWWITHPNEDFYSFPDLEYGNYCGPNNECKYHHGNGRCTIGGGTCPESIDGMDNCCVFHDACYCRGDDYNVYYFKSVPCPKNMHSWPGEWTGKCDESIEFSYGAGGAQRRCDEEFCNCAASVSLIPGSEAWNYREQMYSVFLCDFIAN